MDKKEGYFKFNNPETFPNLATIDYMFLDNSLVNGFYNIVSITMNKTRYEFREDFLQNKT